MVFLAGAGASFFTGQCLGANGGAYGLGGGSTRLVYVLAAATARGPPHLCPAGRLTRNRRLTQHNSGTGARSTRGLVWEIIYVERLATPSEAMSREWHLKRDRRFRKLLCAHLHDI